MTEIEFSLKKDNFKFVAKGHAGYAEIGKDIVCAGISTLSFSMAKYLIKAEEYKKVEDLYLDLYKPGYMEIRCKVINPVCYEVIDTMLDAFIMLKENYPKNICFSPKGRE